MRRVLLAAAALAALLVPASAATGHAVLETSVPAAGERLGAAPERVSLTFSEPVQLLGEDALDVLDSEGAPVTAGEPRVRADDPRVAEVPLRPGLPEDTYTVRWSVIGADSHVVPGVIVFGIGPGELLDPVAAPASGGPSETGPWWVAARALELVAVGGLLGLVGVRALVWAPAWRRGPAVPDDEREHALAWGRDAFWVGFGALAVGAVVAEGLLVAVQSASVLGVPVWEAARDADGVGRVLADTRFGTLVQLRGALLFAAFAVGAGLFLREYGTGSRARGPGKAAGAGGAVGAALLAVPLLAAAGAVAAQGHAWVAPLPALQIGAHVAHVAGVAVWMGALAMGALALVRLPRVAPHAGPDAATRVLARVSRVAAVAVAVVVAAGVVRAAGELADPAELWETAYGRTILYKLLGLSAIAAVALHARRILVALARLARPGRPALATARRAAAAELALGLGVVVLAALLAGQVPGGR